MFNVFQFWNRFQKIQYWILLSLIQGATFIQGAMFIILFTFCRGYIYSRDYVYSGLQSKVKSFYYFDWDITISINCWCEWEPFLATLQPKISTLALFLSSCSMTSLLTPNVAHSTGPSFRPKTNNPPIKKFLSLAVSWVK